MRSRDEIKEFNRQMMGFKGTMVERAKEFAEFAHQGQIDKAGQAYIYHPERVAAFTEETLLWRNMFILNIEKN